MQEIFPALSTLHPRNGSLLGLLQQQLALPEAISGMEYPAKGCRFRGFGVESDKEIHRPMLRA